MEEKMTLKEVSIELPGMSWLRIAAGGIYLWHIARQMASWWTDGRISKNYNIRTRPPTTRPWQGLSRTVRLTRNHAAI